MFQQPSDGDRVDMNGLVGSLCLFWVRGVREGINTPYGEKEALACDIHVLDGAKGGEKFENALIFQGVLIGSLRSAAGGEPVLARVGTGVAKPGQKPPFVLEPFTDADAALATGYIQRMPQPFQAPAAGPTPAAAPPPWSGATTPPAAASPAAPAATNGHVDYSNLPLDVQELLRQNNMLPPVA